MPSTTKPHGFMIDADGNRSYGRLASALLVFVSISVIYLGFKFPLSADYCLKVLEMTLTAGGLFYLYSKGQQALSAGFGAAKSFLLRRTAQPLTPDE